ncbi:DUF4349 domain-containing protein [Candidatus Bathyarchaeota archaeon]|nr:DUF4349 domain-containing protein [Candidatus Bathyarchaeota archaeon]
MVILAAIILTASSVAGALLTQYGLDGRYQAGSESRPSALPEPAGHPLKGSDFTTVQERMVIYNGYLLIETGDLAGTVEKIRTLAERYGGYVAGTSRSTFGNQATAEISIRIPQDKFHTSIREIETYGKVLDERTTSEDVTEHYIDLKARLKNLQTLEKNLVELLARAETVDEILKVEQELGRVRGEIDSLQGQINYIERNVTMSLITVSLREPTPPFTPPGMDWGETFEIALRGFFAVIRGLIVLVVSLLPIMFLVGVPAYFIARRWRVKKQIKE